MRPFFAVAGLAALAWGGWLGWEIAAASARDGLQALAWLAGGPIVHDAVIAPLVGVVALAVARRVPRPWRAPVAAGGVLSGVLALLALPLLWRPFGVPANPGLHDANYGLGLAIALGAVWLAVIAVGLLRAARGRARG